MYSTKEKSIFLVFIGWILFMVSTFLYSKIVKEVYPALVMPTFKGVLLKNDKITISEFKINIYFANHDSMIVERDYIFDQLHGREYIVYNYNYLLTKAIVEDATNSSNEDQIKLKQFKQYFIQKIQSKTGRMDATQLILFKYKKVFDLEQNAFISKICSNKRVFELSL